MSGHPSALKSSTATPSDFPSGLRTPASAVISVKRCPLSFRYSRHVSPSYCSGVAYDFVTPSRVVNRSVSGVHLT